MREIIGTIILMIIAVIVGAWIIIDQGQYIRQQDHEIRELYAHINDLKLYMSMQEQEAKDKEADTYKEQGIASWYGYESGNITANGEPFDPNGFSAAHKYLPIPSYIKVTNLENKKSIIVRVNDRGPFVMGRIIDLSAGAAKKLGFYKQGTARVLVETIDIESMRG